MQDEKGNDDSGNRIGEAKPFDSKLRAHVEAPNPCGAEPDEDGDARPDVRGEVERVGGERIAMVAFRDSFQLAGTAIVDRDGQQQNEEGPDRMADSDRMDEDANDGFGGDPDARCQHEEGLDEAGEIFDLAVPVGMVLVRGLVGDADGDQSERRRRADRSRMGSIGEHAE